MRSSRPFVDVVRGLVGLLCLLCGEACRGTEDALLVQTRTDARAIRALIARGDYAGAQVSAEQLVRAVRDGAGGASPEALTLALDVLVEARWRNADISPDTLTNAEQAVRRRQTRPDGQDAASSLRNLGRVLLVAGRAREASERFQTSLDTLERLAGPRDAALTDTLDALGEAQAELGTYDEATRVLRRSLQIKERASAREPLGIARTLELLSLVSLRRGRYGDARSTLERALDIRRAQPRHPDTGVAYGLLGDLLWFEGRPAAARDAYQRCVSIARNALRADHPAIAHCMRRLGNTLASLGDTPGALALFQGAAAIAERSLGVGHPSFAGYLNDLANAHQSVMDFRNARALYERALAVRERQLGPDHQDVATIVYNLAVVSSDLGDFPEARRQFDRAIAIWRSRLGADHPFVAFATASLARMLLQQGNDEDALPLQRQVLATRERSLGPSHLETADALTDLASTLLVQGRIAEAAGVSERALRIWEQAGAPDSPLFAAALTVAANVLASTGDLRGAREDYARALAIVERAVGADHPTSVDLRIRLASVAHGNGQHGPALDQALSAEEAARRFLLLTLRYLAEREALSYVSQRPTGLHLALSLISPSGRQAAEDVARVLDAVVRSRALVFDELAARRRTIGAAARTEPVASWAAWVSARQRLANLTVRAGQAQASSNQSALLHEARREAEYAERALAEQSASFKAERGKPAVGLNEVKAALPPRSALVSFVRYDRAVDTMSTIVGSRRALASYLAFVQDSVSGPVVIPLGPAGAIDRAIAEWRLEVTAGVTGAAPRASAERTLRSIGSRLRQRIWDPIEPHLRGVNRIFVVPDGALHLANLAALPVGPGEYLIERGPVVHFLTAERDLVELSRRRPTSSIGVLALGGAVFDSSGAPSDRRPAGAPGASSTAESCDSFRSLHFRYLPGTLSEAQDVARLWTQIAKQAPPPVRLLSGTTANESTFKTEAPKYRVLHLATHGFFLGEACRSAPERTRAVGGLTSAIETGGVPAIGESPLLRSGLALAGANHPDLARPGEEDGILTAEEVTALNLEGVEWAVLSACDTGLGEIKVGEGVFGLRRAFQLAGARTVITSLWPVEDESTRTWMRALYEGRLHGQLDTADAVRRADLTVLNARRAKGLSTHPFYWAAFVAAGDWR